MFDILMIIVCLAAPWWVALPLGIIGIVLFPWYVEIIIAGALYDTLFGIPSVWYYHILHTGMFSLPLLVGEYIKSKVHV